MCCRQLQIPWFNEHLDKNMMAKSVAKSANIALCLRITKCKAFGGTLYDVFTKLYGVIKYCTVQVLYKYCPKQSK